MLRTLVLMSGLAGILVCQRSMAADEPAEPPPAPPAPAAEKVPAPAPAERAAVPDEKDVAEAIKNIKERLKDKYLHAKGPERRELAHELLKMAEEKSGAERYALLREGRDLAAAAGDSDGAFAAATLAERFYLLPAMDWQIAVLQEMLRNAGADDAAHLTEKIESVLHDAVAADDFERAEKILAIQEGAARKSRDPAMESKAQGEGRRLKELKVEWEKLKTARETLKRSPDDAAANLAMGKYLCLSKRDWDHGLSYLAKGADAALKSAAILDGTGADEAKGQAEVGDVWWALAEKSKSPAREVLRQRAGYWYDLALAGLGEERQAIVSKRLAMVEQTGRAGSGPAMKVGEVVSISSKMPGMCCRLQMSPDGRLVALGGEGSVEIWDLKTTKRLQELKKTGIAGGMAFSPDGRLLVIGTLSGHVGVWDVSAGQEVREITDYDSGVYSVAFSADGRLVMASCGSSKIRSDRNVRYWDIKTGKVAAENQEEVNSNSEVQFLATLKDGHLGQIRNGWISIWDLHTHAALQSFFVKDLAPPASAAMSGDGHQAIIGGVDGELAIYDVSTGKLLKKLKGHGAGILIGFLAMAPDGKRFASAGADRMIRVWDMRTGQSLQSYELPKRPCGVAYGPDGRWIVAGSIDGTIKVWGLP
ncbi:MAG TPA: PQQ-binding-like beta-propeller repeat protein [Tepidisphaeraceae bacterium]